MQTHSSTSLDRLQALLPEVFNPQAQKGELYLKLRLGGSLDVAISLQPVVETLRIPATALTPIPNMPSCTLGLIGSQGRVFWVVDLSELLGLMPDSLQPRQYDILVVQAPTGGDRLGTVQSDAEEELLLGFSVQQIQRTLRLQSEQLSPPSSQVPPSLRPYVQSSVQQAGEELLILNLDALLQAPQLCHS